MHAREEHMRGEKRALLGAAADTFTLAATGAMAAGKQAIPSEITILPGEETIAQTTRNLPVRAEIIAAAGQL